ncbi:ABC transporter substrate-binding protein [Microbacterium sp. E-13]|uniref:ABC transporter substrate-binding protein n=1 Tax=Microbacterium sp. E-13 TaxID=3404048 RepID=UPI003CF9ADE8
MPEPTVPVPRKARVLTAGLAVVAAGALLAGCAGGPTTQSAAPAEPQSGGVLRVGVGEGLICVDPHQVYTYDGWAVSSAITDSLTDLDPKTNEVVPLLATDWTVNEDASEYTFHLRDDVTFSDGTEFTAQSVKNNLDDTLANTPGSSGVPVYLGSYVETLVDDPYTATVRFSQPNPAFLIGTSTPTLSMLADATFESTPDERCQGDVIGTGPFVLDEFRPGQGATLSGREGYSWGSSLNAHDGDAYLDGIEFSIVSSGSVREGQVGSGQLDVAWGIGTRAVEELERSGSEVISRVVSGMPMSLLANTTDGRILADPAVRDALQITFDREGATAAASNDVYQAATSVLAAGMYGWADVSGRFATDTEAAAQILEDAGWVEGPDGIREKDGAPLEVEVVYSEDLGPVYGPTITLLQEQAKAVGIDLVLTPTTAAALSQASVDLTYDLMSTNITQSDPNVLALILDYVIPDKDLLASEGITDLMAESSTLPNGPEREAVLKELQEALIDSGLILPIWDAVELTAVAPNAAGVRFDAQAKLDFYDAWLAK